MQAIPADRGSTYKRKGIEEGDRGIIDNDVKLDDIVIKEELGSGTFGQVRVCESKKSGKLFAVKILPNTKAIIAEKHLLEKEIAIQVKLLHENVVQLITKNVIHRDIKPENYLYGFDGLWKLADFGLSISTKGMTKVGTENYQPPEILDGKPHSFPVDIWSLGCVFYECLEAQSPFPQSSTKAMIDAIIRVSDVCKRDVDCGPKDAFVCLGGVSTCLDEQTTKGDQNEANSGTCCRLYCHPHL
ncbi:hypothetical protein CRE_30243 [Caenorhabditis remanei]|uniref:Protein kinase domain-containing protein n=1 Tax=Caenorhabditis remanei TaxID=31234 RepID=E3NK26_CAERE|nr:hypothetical protein CRE_30243 [Caenorhabditis remanei]